MSTTQDDLEAVRTIAQALEPFDTKTQERIIRWAQEKLGLAAPTQTHNIPPGSPSGKDVQGQQRPPRMEGNIFDIKTFVTEKNPVRDTHFAATVAHYYKFEAPEAERKDSISKEDLQEACRKVGRTRLNNPLATLNNAHRDGFLDRAGETGKYVINTVGENLVAMTLPGSETERPKPRNRTRKKTTKKEVSKRAKKSKKTAPKKTKKRK